MAQGWRDMRKHLTALAALHIGFSLVLVLVGLLVLIILPTAGVFADEPDALPLFSTIGVAVGTFFLVLAVPGIVGGIGLFKRWPWARILVLVLAAVHILNIPIGTALGIYTIWVLVQDETEALFETSI
jgi:hypothetical protein